MHLVGVLNISRHSHSVILNCYFTSLIALERKLLWRWIAPPFFGQEFFTFKMQDFCSQLKGKSEPEILEFLSTFESNDDFVNSKVGTDVWNLAVSIKKNSKFVAALRVFGIEKIEIGLGQNRDFYPMFKLIRMMITTCDCFYSILDYDSAQNMLDRAYTLFSKVKDSPDLAKMHLVGLNLKFHTCLLQWATTNNPSVFQLANIAITEAISYIGENEVKKLFKTCVKLADLSRELKDKDQWFQIFQIALDKSKCPRTTYDSFRLELGILHGQVLIKLKNIHEAELLLGNLLEEYFSSVRVYYLNFQLLELKNASRDDFCQLFNEFKEKAVKNEPNVIYSILHLLSQNQCADLALQALDELAQIDCKFKFITSVVQEPNPAAKDAHYSVTQLAQRLHSSIRNPARIWRN